MGNYDLELENVVLKIDEEGHKLVMIQLPDGLKMEAKEIVDTIEEKTNAKVIIWSGSCFGACDTPSGMDGIGVDLYLQWGHNIFRKIQGW